MLSEMSYGEVLSRRAARLNLNCFLLSSDHRCASRAHYINLDSPSGFTLLLVVISLVLLLLSATTVSQAKLKRKRTTENINQIQLVGEKLSSRKIACSLF